MNLTQDILTHVQRTIPTAASADLEGRSAVELMTTYLSWRTRAVPRRPRTVHVAPGFASRLGSDDELRAMIEQLVRELESGDEIGERTNTLPDPLLDFLLDEWRVSHVRLDAKERGTADRSAVVLVAFTDTDAYLIGTYDATTTPSDVAAVLIEDFPHAGFVRAFPSVGRRTPTTTEDRAAVRAAGIDPRSVVERPDGTYLLGTGSVGSGTSGWNARLRAQAVIDAATTLARHLGGARSAAETDPAVRFVFLDTDRFAVRNERTGIEVPVPAV